MMDLFSYIFDIKSINLSSRHYKYIPKNLTSK